MTKKQRETRSKTTPDLVYGLGATGLSIARHLKRNNVDAVYHDSRAHPPGIEELKDLISGAQVVCGVDTKNLLKNVQRVIVSPGIPERDPLLVEARRKNINVTSDIDLFVGQASKPFVAVTGSNGKSTVATLLSLMCDAAGMAARAGANLGTPALDLLTEEPPDVYILELSSFQLQRVTVLPAQVAALLNISADHLDWHDSVEEYAAAKYRIFHEAQAAVFNRDDADAEQHVPAGIPSLSFGLDAPAEGHYGIREEDGVEFLACGPRLLLAVDDIALIGRHNQANALAALAMGDLIGLPLPSMLQVLHEFPGLPHRMQVVDWIGGTRYVNDSKATNVGAAIASVESIDGLIVLIAGGDGKGGDFDELAKSVHHRLRCAILIGEDGPAIAAALEGLAPVHRAENMQEAVALAASVAESGDTVLLAPACASFDQYRNYQQRGDDFCHAVGGLRP